VHPVGWNIANGGTDTRSEMLNPQDTIERELREELLIADFANDTRYTFSANAGKPWDHPVHAAARHLWTRKFPEKEPGALKTGEVQVEWLDGPDSLSVQTESGDGQLFLDRRTGFFLNINGEDFGIEFDKVGRIRLPDSVTLFDGEIDGGRMVNCP